MSARLNHLAVLVAAIAYFIWGYVWYGLIFTKWWGPIPMNSFPMLYVQSFITGWIMAYFAGIALTKGDDPPSGRRGVEFGLFMGIGLIATAMYNAGLYASNPGGMWAIDAGYVVTGLAIMSAIVAGWQKKVAA